MSEPSADDVDFDAGLEQVSCSGVSKQMRTDASWLWPWRIPSGRMSSDDFIDPKARERMIASRTKDWAGGGSLAFGEQLLKMFNRFVPERAEAPLVSLAVQTHFTGRLEIEVFDSKIDDFLSASPGVVCAPA